MTENQIESRVKSLLKSKMEKAIYKGASIKLPVSTRLNITAVAVLDIIAESVGETRTNLAAELLTAAIQDAAREFGFSAPNTAEFLKEIQPRLDELLPESDRESGLIAGFELGEEGTN